MDSRLAAFTAERADYWDGLARSMRKSSVFGEEYYRRLREVYQFLVSPGARVLEVGCAGGDLLASVHPREGVGVDFSQEWLRVAAQHHPHLRFVHADAHDLSAVMRIRVHE